MRCDECKVEPVTPGHFCECCGRKLSLQERKALEATIVMPVFDQARPASSDDRLVGVHFPPAPPIVQAPACDPAPPVHVAPRAAFDEILEAHFAGQAPVAPEPEAYVAVPAPTQAPRVAADAWIEPTSARQVAAVPEPWEDPAETSHASVDVSTDRAPEVRCEICGASAANGQLCIACQLAYHSLLDSKTFPLPVDAALTAEPAQVPPVAIEPEAIETAAEPVVAESAAPVAPVPPPAPALVAAPAVRIQVRAPIVFAEVATQPAPEPQSAAPASHDEAPKVTRPARPMAPVAAAVLAPSRPPSNARTIAAAAAVIVAVGALGFPLGKLWLGRQEVAVVQEPQPAPAPAPAPAPPPERVAPPPPIVQAAATTPPPQIGLETQKVSLVTKAAPKPAVAPQNTVAPRPTPSRVPAKPVRQPGAAVRPPAAVAVASPVVAAPVPEVVAPAPVAAPEPKPEAVAAPSGPFFELRDVNDAPRVATRVEPQVPDEFRGQAMNDVVIVRVLVTQTGRPHMMTLLRRSRAGASLDNAVLAAVKQWTFVPARKRGEPVSCWYHVALPVKF